MDNECPLVYFSLLLFGGALEPVIPNMLFALNSFSSVCSGPVDAVGFFFSAHFRASLLICHWSASLPTACPLLHVCTSTFFPPILDSDDSCTLAVTSASTRRYPSSGQRFKIPRSFPPGGHFGVLFLFIISRYPSFSDQATV